MNVQDTFPRYISVYGYARLIDQYSSVSDLLSVSMIIFFKQYTHSSNAKWQTKAKQAKVKSKIWTEISDRMKAIIDFCNYIQDDYVDRRLYSKWGLMQRKAGEVRPPPSCGE